ncbi:hypothetical protein DYB32_010162 [Aphanomyces invadans]|uniref:Choline/carnitine acyltransferase domain-containing protein n=1 Tax=Aphanomyces invadans TaxID=157072 RepID=A0A418AGV5_9STRA|nr:hypothetical protein DYB32_010162 [Aphanomyces invadans]
MTAETKKFLELFVDASANLLEKTAALRAAVQAHSAMVKRCMNGQGRCDDVVWNEVDTEDAMHSLLGVERHLYALQQLHHIVSPGEPEPAFFRDDGWLKLGRSIISTSNCGNPSLRLFGFGPVVPEGFGIGYIIKDDGIQFCVASKHRQTQRYCDTLESYLVQMQNLLTKEEHVMFPNLAKSTRCHAGLGRQRSGSIEDTGYGFFDGGATDQRKVNKTPLVGRKL